MKLPWTRQIERKQVFNLKKNVGWTILLDIQNANKIGEMNEMFFVFRQKVNRSRQFKVERRRPNFVQQWTSKHLPYNLSYLL